MSRAAVAPLIRPLAPGDRARVERLTRATGLFREIEIPVALEVFDAAVGAGRAADPDYESAGAEVDGALAGWIVWGPTPGTVGTFDLYWIVVDPAHQGAGVGTALHEEMERRIAGRARLVVVETGGRAEYGATRGFYAARGYEVAARITDYYEPGDDLVKLVKRHDRTARPG